MLTDEQIKSIKQQIINQIENWNQPDEKKNQAISQINEMPSEQLEEFIVKNNLIKKSQQQETHEQTKKQETQAKKQDEQQNMEQCPFCLISQEKIPSFKILENQENIAVLEINPISKGHTIIIPKNHISIENLPISTYELVRNMIKLLNQKLKPNQIQLSSGTIQQHIILNIIPIFGNETGKREKESPKQLKQLQEQLIKKESLENKENQMPSTKQISPQNTISNQKKLKPKNQERIPKAPKRIP